MKKIFSMCLAVMLGAGLFVVLWSTPLVAAEPIILGAATSVSTPYGKACVRAAELAVEEINAAGGVKVGDEKRPLKLVVTDTRCGEPTTSVHDALMAYEKLITEDKPVAIVLGALRSEAILAAMDMVAKYKVPHIHSIAQSPAFQKKFAKDPKKYKYLFRTTTDALIFGSYIEQALDVLRKEYGLKRVLFVYQDTLWAQAFAGMLKKHCSATGWKEVGFDAYAAGAKDFSLALNKAKSTKAQVLIMAWDVPLGAAIFAKQYTAMKVPALVVGFMPAFGAPNAAKNLGPGVEYSITVEFPVGSSLALAKLPKTGEFLGRYKKKFGQLPDSSAVVSSSYDAVFVVAKAIERAGSLDPDKVVAELEKTNYKGVSGTVKFNKNHIVVYGTEDPNKTALCVVFQWQKGADGTLKRVPVYPPVLAEGKIKLPPGLTKD